MSNEMKVLFIHNSVPEYRIKFWIELSKLIELKLLITDKNIEKKVYNLKKDTKDLSISYWGTADGNDLVANINQFNSVILPPIDDFKEYGICRRIKAKCKKYHIPYIVWTEKWEQSKSEQPIKKRLKNSIHAMMIANVASEASHCIAAGSCSKKYLLSLGIPEDKITIAYDSSTSPKAKELTDIRKKYRMPDNALIILFLGRLIHRKGCRVLIEAVKPLIKNKKNIYLIIAGSGIEENNLRELAGENQNIIFTGKIQPENRRTYFEQSNLFVLPSIIENGTIEAWGLTVNEALECGTPVITTDAVGSGYDIVDRYNGIIVKNNNSLELAKALNYVLNNNYNRSLIKERYKKYNVNSMANSFIEAIDATLHRQTN